MEAGPDMLDAVPEFENWRQKLSFLIISTVFAVGLLIGYAFRGLELRELKALKAVAEAKIAALEVEIKAKL